MDNHNLVRQTRLGYSGFRKRIVQATALLGITVAAFFHLVGPAPAESLRSLPIPIEGIRVIGQAAPTDAWVNFCQRYPGECEVNIAEPATIILNADMWFTIVQVNERVNSTILAVTDQDHWNVIDRWDYPDDGMGDCEDIQLLKRRLLIEVGLPRRAMRMTVVIDESGAGHAVMMVLTDRGDFILDNKRDAVLPWQQTNYLYLKREGTDGSAWVAIGEDAVPIVTANR